ncbi:MAG: NAD(P)H-hydrate epimerase, partial [Lachnospiraceae bacterium]|nr:NAD(P)H-hydrate epimerase [Lachnospiraceae bacterium]
MKAIEYILTGKEMQLYDKNTIEKLGVPSLVLMEQAALAALEEIEKEMPLRNKRILILSGTGNNGGDALALARLLWLKEALVKVVLVSNSLPKKISFTNEAGQQYEIIQKMGIPVVTELPSDSYDMIIDGIFGVGLNRKIEGKTAELIALVNSYSGRKISLDIPSGVDATTGQIHGVAFYAHKTITFAFYKRGLFFSPGSEYCGERIKKTIGITQHSFLGSKPKMAALNEKITSYLP